ncbi:MAG: class I SAM-dependent methyltransferase [Myxococcota bacterium]
MATYRAFDWYQTPQFYDIIFDTESRLEGDFLEAALDRYATGRSRRRVLEPACGSGRLVAEMARRGWRVLGYDLNDGAVAYAKRRLSELGTASAGPARVVRGAMQTYRVPGRFDLAHCLVSSFRYLLSENDARSHLDGVARALRPGGIYVLGLHLSQYGHESIGRERWVADRGGVEVVCNIQSWPSDRQRRRQQMRSRLVVTQRGRTDRYQTLWQFRTYSVRQFRALLRRVPQFDHVATHDFDYRLDEPHQLGAKRLDQVVILRRRADDYSAVP